VFRANLCLSETQGIPCGGEIRNYITLKSRVMTSSFQILPTVIRYKRKRIKRKGVAFGFSSLSVLLLWLPALPANISREEFGWLGSVKKPPDLKGQFVYSRLEFSRVHETS